MEGLFSGPIQNKAEKRYEEESKPQESVKQEIAEKPVEKMKTFEREILHDPYADNSEDEGMDQPNIDNDDELPALI